MGWAGLKNGELLTVAEAEGIEVLVTGDQTLNYEQNLAGRRLTVVALSAIQLPIIRGSPFLDHFRQSTVLRQGLSR